jgi:Domain of unknown function (DUF3536)/Glycosyl hydrolase family 57
MSRGRLVVHGHFYQPLRVDPFSGTIPIDPSAAPFENWNARVAAECYRPNAERRNPALMSWNVGPTLAEWLETGDPKAYRGFIDGDRPADRDPAIPLTRGNGMAQPYHHAIAALASAADRRTEIRWGMRDFLLRFGREAEGLWFPETAVDVGSLRIAAEEGIRYTILAPWQAATPGLETRRPYRVELGGGRSIVVAFYDSGLSGAISFEPDATADADRFARERVAPRLTGQFDPTGGTPLVVIATDGELYGHHQPFRELFLQRLIRPGPDQPDHGFDVVDLASALAPVTGSPFRTVRINERTSWSCHHGVLRWSGECGCVADGHWKAPLRAAFERLAAGIDAITVAQCAAMPREPDPWAARDAYIDVVLGAEPSGAFAAHWLGGRAPVEARRALLRLMEAQRWRLAMFTSDGWYWDDPMRPETRQVMRFAARAAQLADGVGGTDLERRLLEDLTLLRSPRHGLDGAAIYRSALEDVGQVPAVRGGLPGEEQASA